VPEFNRTFTERPRTDFRKSDGERFFDAVSMDGVVGFTLADGSLVVFVSDMIPLDVVLLILFEIKNDNAEGMKMII